jgi:hypothetical protein
MDRQMDVLIDERTYGQEDRWDDENEIFVVPF